MEPIPQRGPCRQHVLGPALSPGQTQGGEVRDAIPGPGEYREVKSALPSPGRGLSPPQTHRVSRQ